MAGRKVHGPSGRKTEGPSGHGYPDDDEDRKRIGDELRFNNTSVIGYILDQNEGKSMELDKLAGMINKGYTNARSDGFRIPVKDLVKKNLIVKTRNAATGKLELAKPIFVEHDGEVDEVIYVKAVIYHKTPHRKIAKYSFKK